MKLFELFVHTEKNLILIKKNFFETYTFLKDKYEL